jgi:hypothetical protein
MICDLASENHFKLALVSLKQSSVSDHFMAHFIFFCPSPEISHLSFSGDWSVEINAEIQ